VDERAYAPLSAKLAEQGVYVIIAKMPFHLAVFKTDAATTIKAEATHHLLVVSLRP
jgi:hypothetical protein